MQENVRRLENIKMKIENLDDFISDRAFRSKLLHSLPKGLMDSYQWWRTITWQIDHDCDFRGLLFRKTWKRRKASTTSTIIIIVSYVKKWAISLKCVRIKTYCWLPPKNPTRKRKLIGAYSAKINIQNKLLSEVGNVKKCDLP